MSLKSYNNVTREMNNLEITGLVMELPRAKEPTRSIERKILTPIVHTPKTPPNRSSSQMTVKKQPSITLLNNGDSSAKDAKIKNYEEEIRKLKKIIEDLELQLKSSQKTVKEKEKTIEDLTKKLKGSLDQEKYLAEKISELEVNNKDLKEFNDSLSRKLIENEELMRSTSNKANDDLIKLKNDHLNEMNKLKDEHIQELKSKDEKLDLLKKQIAGAFKDNSWERQMQIDELTRELKRTQEEYELIKFKLKGYKNTNIKNHDSSSCSNCSQMLHKLEEKSSTMKEKDLLLNDLIIFVRKFQNQTNFNDELTKISNSNRTLFDLLNKSNINLRVVSTNSNASSFKNKK